MVTVVYQHLSAEEPAAALFYSCSLTRVNSGWNTMAWYILVPAQAHALFAHQECWVLLWYVASQPLACSVVCVVTLSHVQNLHLPLLNFSWFVSLHLQPFSLKKFSLTSFLSAFIAPFPLRLWSSSPGGLLISLTAVLAKLILSHFVRQVFCSSFC